jgi:hypothetical protein
MQHVKAFDENMKRKSFGLHRFGWNGLIKMDFVKNGCETLGSNQHQSEQQLTAESNGNG